MAFRRINTTPQFMTPLLDAVPTEHVAQVLGKCFLDQPIVAIDVRDRSDLRYGFPHFHHYLNRAVQVEIPKILFS